MNELLGIKRNIKKYCKQVLSVSNVHSYHEFKNTDYCKVLLPHIALRLGWGIESSYYIFKLLIFKISMFLFQFTFFSRLTLHQSFESITFWIICFSKILLTKKKAYRTKECEETLVLKTSHQRAVQFLFSILILQLKTDKLVKPNLLKVIEFTYFIRHALNQRSQFYRKNFHQHLTQFSFLAQLTINLIMMVLKEKVKVNTCLRYQSSYMRYEVFCE